MTDDLPPVPYVKLTLLPELATEEDGYSHCPLAIESWPPGLDVRRMLTYALTALDQEDGGDNE